MAIVLFEDSMCDALAPVTHARLACAIHAASYTLVELLDELGVLMGGIVRPHLEALQRIDFPQLRPMDAWSGADAHSRPLLLLNARTAPTPSNLAIIQRWLASESTDSLRDRGPLVVRDGSAVVAVVRPPWTFAELAQAGFEGLGPLLEKLELPSSATVDAQEDREFKLETFALPHEIVACNMAHLADNLARRIEHGERQQRWVQSSEGVFLAADASLGEYVLTDTRKGPIVIESGAVVGPYTLLRGPLYIGRNSKILEHSAIKDAVTLCHTTKIGGEVEASVVEPYTNKQHHGFLGHSYLGSWINLGAGTCNSDLKNTYGTVNMEYPSGKAATNMQFLGCIMGDYSKTAINTGIFTGKVIGVCSMMYGFVTTNVPSFVNYARLFGQIASLPPEVMINTQQRMFARRNVQQRGCDIQLIYDLHLRTQSERDRLGDALIGA